MKVAGMQPFPLDETKIKRMGALLKGADYRSAPSYFAVAKRRHIELAYQWTDQLEQAVRDAQRSCLRGIGPDKHCEAFDFKALGAVRHDFMVEGTGVPARPKDVGILASWFALRELEVASCLVKDVTINHTETGCGIVTLHLSTQKNDSESRGCYRSHGCAGCLPGAGNPLCPVAAALRLHAWAEEHSLKDDALLSFPRQSWRFLPR
jgi:hypothetical protein